MGGITANESAPVPETIGDQATADPILLAEDFVPKPIIHAEDRTKCPIPINAFEISFVRRKMVVYQPFVLTVDRYGRSAATWIERHVHPGRLLDDHILQLWSINVGGLYPLDDIGAC